MTPRIDPLERALQMIARIGLAAWLALGAIWTAEDGAFYAATVFAVMVIALFW